MGELRFGPKAVLEEKARFPEEGYVPVKRVFEWGCSTLQGEPFALGSKGVLNPKVDWGETTSGFA